MLAKHKAKYKGCFTSMNILAFSREVFASRPGVIAAICGLFFLAGVLELLSIAMVLPVLMGLFSASGEAGFAGEIIAAIGLSGLSLSGALILISVFMLLRGLLIQRVDFIMAGLARDLEVEIRGALFSSFLQAGWPYLVKQDLGRIQNLILRESEKYSIAIQKLGQFLSAALIAGILILSSVMVSWQMAAMFAVAVLPYMVLTRLVSKRISACAKRRVTAAGEVSAQIAESVMHLKYIKASSLEDRTSAQFMARVSEYAGHFYNIMCYTRFIKNFPEIFGVLMISVLIIVSHSLMGQNPADMVFFLLLMFRGYRQVSGVQTVLASLVENIPSYETCLRFIRDARENRENRGQGRDFDARSLRIGIRNLSFSYRDDAPPVLQDINLDIPETGLVAFAGPSGSGKTTLADLLLGLMPPQKGDILINGDLGMSEINLEQWRGRIGYVPQEPFLIYGTIRENILLHATDRTDARLHAVAALARVDEFVRDLPGQYETPLGLINTGLSGGQKQRIALARALAHDPLFLILDEATSALDARTEKDIREAVKNISRTRPVLMIAHSLEMLKEADIIHVLEKGRILESGSYESLIDQKGALWRLQGVL